MRKFVLVLSMVLQISVMAAVDNGPVQEKLVPKKMSLKTGILLSAMSKSRPNNNSFSHMRIEGEMS